MRGNGKMFISHTHLDNALCEPLLPALDAWGVDYWFDVEQLGPGQHLSERIQKAITERSIFLRICTANTYTSFWMPLELNAFRGLQLSDQQHGHRGGRISINLILDPAYKANTAYAANAGERADIVVDATNRMQADWLAELRTVLDLSRAPKPRPSRRTVLGVGAAAVVSVAALSGAGIVYESRLQNGQAAVAYPKPRVIPFENPQSLDTHLKWFFVAGGEDANAPGVALVGDVLYATTHDGLYALKSSDGSILWSVPKFQGDWRAVALSDGSRVYAGDGNGNLAAFDAASGSVIWQTPSGSVYSGISFALANGTIFALDDNGFVNALNAATGAVLWQSPNVGKDALGHSAPTAADGAIYVGSPDGNLYALNAADGSLLWQHQTGGKIVATPVVANGLVYFGSEDQRVYALHTSDGSVAWTYVYTFQVDVSPVIGGNVAYIGLGQYLYALDATSGTVLWKAPAGQADASGYVSGGDETSGNATVAGDLIFLTSGAYLYAFSASKKQFTWRFQTRGNSFSYAANPVAGNGLVYYAAGDHVVYALSAS